MKILRNPHTRDFPKHRYKEWYGKRFPCIHCHALLAIDSEEDIHPFNDDMCCVYCPFCEPRHRITLYFREYKDERYLAWFQ